MEIIRYEVIIGEPVPSSLKKSVKAVTQEAMIKEPLFCIWKVMVQKGGTESLPNAGYHVNWMAPGMF